jgi:hypothetical protein
VVAATREEAPTLTPVPTVPPRTATPVGAVPLPTRPVRSTGTDAAIKAGKQVGPVITHLGLARADGTKIEPKSTQKDGTTIWENSIGSGFILVVEAKPGISNVEIGRRINAYDKDDPRSRPDLEIQTNKDLGDGSKVVCDKRRPNIGGVPGINPPSFADGREIADALNDLSCRFELFIESASACTVTKYGDFAFLTGHGGAHNLLGKLNYELMSLSRVERFLGRLLVRTQALRDSSWESAETHLVAAAESWPDLVLFQFDLGLLYRKRGREQEARAAFRRVTEMAPVHPTDGSFQDDARRHLEELGS